MMTAPKGVIVGCLLALAISTGAKVDGNVLKSFIGENGLEILVHGNNTHSARTDEVPTESIILQEPSDLQIGDIVVSDGIQERVIAIGENGEYITEIVE